MNLTSASNEQLLIVWLGSTDTDLDRDTNKDMGHDICEKIRIQIWQEYEKYQYNICYAIIDIITLLNIQNESSDNMSLHFFTNNKFCHQPFIYISSFHYIDKEIKKKRW